MTTLQDIMGLISKRKIKTPTDKDYIISAAYTDTQEVLKPQPKMEPSLINIGALKKFIANGTQGPAGPQGPQGVQGIQGIQGISGTSGLETSTRYSPVFQATGMTFTGSGTTYPTYNSYYIKAGLLVSFVIEIDFTTVTNFGTGQYKVALPFAPAFGYNHFSGWIWADPNVSPDTGTGHTILNADTSGITTVLDLHYLKQSGGANSPIREGLWIQGTPVALTTISKAYINGTYICVP